MDTHCAAPGPGQVLRQGVGRGAAGAAGAAAARAGGREEESRSGRGELRQHGDRGPEVTHFTIETSAIWYLWLTKCALFHFYKSISSEWD